MITTQTIYFTMVHHPIKGRIRAGNACMTRKAAQVSIHAPLRKGERQRWAQPASST
ncbi:MAG TPA: hypothetical protein PKX75_23190 [Nitrospira sp.]|nr:hypothetical protein [Nitrospira sp.]